MLYSIFVASFSLVYFDTSIVNEVTINVKPNNQSVTVGIGSLILATTGAIEMKI